MVRNLKIGTNLLAGFPAVALRCAVVAGVGAFAARQAHESDERDAGWHLDEPLFRTAEDDSAWTDLSTSDNAYKAHLDTAIPTLADGSIKVAANSEESASASEELSSQAESLTPMHDDRDDDARAEF